MKMSPHHPEAQDDVVTFSWQTAFSVQNQSCAEKGDLLTELADHPGALELGTRMDAWSERWRVGRSFYPE